MDKTPGNSGKKETKRDFFVRIVTVQLLLFTMIFVSVLLIVRFSDDKGEALKEQFAEYMREDMDYNDIRALFEKKETAPEAPSPAPEETVTAPTAETAAPADEYAFEEETGTNVTDTNADAEEYLASLMLREPVFPVEGRISSGFGGRISPISHFSEKHKGTDIAAPQGTPVKAVFGGTVSLVDRTPGRGNFLILDHGMKNGKKIQTLYQHCSRILVSEGTVVRAGEIVALVGSTGDSTGPHLHLEYRIDGDCVDAIENIFGGVYEA